MKLGTKYTTPLPPRGPKTGRAYGGMVSAIRTLKGEFTALDLPFPRTHVVSQLNQMARLGELEKVKAGNAGPGGMPAVYRRVNAR